MATKSVLEPEDILIEELGYDDHFHEHHDDDKYRSNFFAKYIFSMDHKMIAKQFLITGIFWAIIGAGMSIIFRLQLGFPEENMAWIKPLLGKWIVVNDAGIGSLAPVTKKNKNTYKNQGSIFTLSRVSHQYEKR